MESQALLTPGLWQIHSPYIIWRIFRAGTHCSPLQCFGYGHQSSPAFLPQETAEILEDQGKRILPISLVIRDVRNAGARNPGALMEQIWISHSVGGWAEGIGFISPAKMSLQIWNEFCNLQVSKPDRKWRSLMPFFWWWKRLNFGFLLWD